MYKNEIRADPGYLERGFICIKGWGSSDPPEPRLDPPLDAFNKRRKTYEIAHEILVLIMWSSNKCSGESAHMRTIHSKNSRQILDLYPKSIR